MPHCLRFPAALCAALVVLSLGNIRAQVVISEFMATNTNSPYVDEDQNHEDWLELQNNGANAVSLNGWYLRDGGST